MGRMRGGLWAGFAAFLPWLAAGAAGQAPESITLFREDFEGGTSAWRFPVGEGHDLVETGDGGGLALALRTRSLPVYALIVGSDAWGDVRIEGRLLFPDSVDAYLGFIYRYRDDGRRIDFGSLYIKGNDSYVQANPRYDTNVARTLHPEHRVPLEGPRAIRVGRWQRFALEVVGAEAHLYVGDMDTPAMTLPFGGHDTGAFGFEPRNPGGPVWLDDLVVRAIPEFTHTGPPVPSPAYDERGLDPADDEPNLTLAVAPPADDERDLTLESSEAGEPWATRWRVLGPLTRHAPEVEGMPFSASLTVTDQGRSVGWRSFATDRRGAVVTGRVTEHRGSRRVAYFHTRILSDRATTTTLELSSVDDLALWVNGEFVGFAPQQRAAWWDAGQNPEHPPILANVELDEGANDVLVRVVGGVYASGGFYLRVASGAR